MKHRDFLARALPIGTRSVLFGAHQFVIHPLFVALAWTRLYGFPRDWRLWFCFAVHDLGYWGLPNMDGPEGETHPEWAAGVAERVCGRGWGDFCRFHSRFWAKQHGAQHSRLCAPDKLATALEPWWLYLPRVWATGELAEYMAQSGGTEGSKYNGEPEVGKYAFMHLATRNPETSYYQRVRFWHARMADYMKRWAYEHTDGREDTWTPAPASPVTPLCHEEKGRAA